MDMESLNPEFALYGSRNKCARTDTVSFPISEVCTRRMTLKKNAISPFGDAREKKSIGATIRIGREIGCLPYAGFFVKVSVVY